jgi:hypothetical protein
MGISSISGNAYSQAVDPTALFREWTDKKLHSRGDRVSFSDEGREKSEEFVKAQIAAKTGPPGMEDMDDASAAGGADPSSALNESAEGQIQDLEAKIKALMDQLMNIMQSALPPEEKMQQAQPVQQQISQLQAQINELKVQMMKEKSA